MIDISYFWASDDEEMKEKLNEIDGRIIAVSNDGDDKWKVIHEKNN